MAALLEPKNEVLGIDLARLGKQEVRMSTQIQPGDDVFRSSSHRCFTEHVSISEEGKVAIPAKQTFEELASVLGTAFPLGYVLFDHDYIGLGDYSY